LGTNGLAVRVSDPAHVSPKKPAVFTLPAPDNSDGVAVACCSPVAASTTYPNELKGAEAAAQKDTLKPMVRRWVVLGEEKAGPKRSTPISSISQPLNPLVGLDLSDHTPEHRNSADGVGQCCKSKDFAKTRHRFDRNLFSLHPPKRMPCHPNGRASRKANFWAPKLPRTPIYWARPSRNAQESTSGVCWKAEQTSPKCIVARLRTSK
jgi:hypothetical protein